MSQNQLISRVQRELRLVNAIIDTKIIQGISYSREARRHKLLVSMLKGASAKRSTWSFASFLF